MKVNNVVRNGTIVGLILSVIILSLTVKKITDRLESHCNQHEVSKCEYAARINFIVETTSVLIDHMINNKTMIEQINNNIKVIENCKITFYSNGPKSINVEKYRDGLTATRTKAMIGVIAVDPKTIKLGSKVFIDLSNTNLNMSGWFRAEDVGGLIKGDHIDVFVNSDMEADNLGVEYRDIVVMSNKGD